MTHPSPSVARLLEQVAAQIRLRRIESGALRGAFWGAVLAVLVLVPKGAYEDMALILATGAWILGIATGAVLGAMRRPGEIEAARIADQSYGLQDRLATCLEYTRIAPSDPLTVALLAETEQRIAALPKQRVVGHHLPREFRFLPLPLVAALVLAIVPPVPGVDNWLPEALTGKTPKDAYASATREERARLFGWDMKQRDATTKQDALQRAAAEKQLNPEENSAFKDKSTNKPKTDFASFVQKGDDRLKLLERADKLPDLQSDFASSKYRMMMQKTQELSAGKGGQMSARRLEQVLREMQRMGKKGGEWSNDVNEGLDALEEGNTEEAMNSMQSALSKLRAQEERERNSRSISGARERTQEDSEDGSGSRGASGSNSNDRMGYSSGGQKGASSTGKATPRLRSTPYDAAIEGQRRGRMPSVETQQTTRPQSIASQLQVMGDMIQYRRAMEDAITREQVPRDYHDQIRDYFKSLQD